MKNTIATTLRTAALAATLLVLPALASATESADRAAELLAIKGSVPVKAAGPYVEVGTFRLQVTAKLGQPAATLPDGTLLYPNFTVDGSQAAGTLVVRFTKGRVTDLALVTPAMATAMMTPDRAQDKILVAGTR